MNFIKSGFKIIFWFIKYAVVVLVCMLAIIGAAEIANAQGVGESILSVDVVDSNLGIFKDQNRTSCIEPGESVDVFRLYEGIYPSTSTINSQTLTSICGVLFGTSTPSIDLENGTGDLTSTPDGDYWVWIQFSNDAEYYFQVERQLGIWSILGSNIVVSAPIYENQFINIISPEYGSTTASTSVDIIINYATVPSIDFRPSTTRRFDIFDAVTNELEYQYSFDLSPNSAESFQLIQNVNLSEGSKIITAGYYETESGALYSELSESFFNVATNTYLSVFGLNSPIDNNFSDLSALNDCSTFDVGCQFQRAIVFLFYPSENVLQKFGNIWQTISTKKPFGYVTVTIEQLENLGSAETPAFVLPDIPFMDTIFSPFRDFMSAILWAIFAIFFYQFRLKKIDI